MSLSEKREKKKLRKGLNYQIRNESESLKKRKITSTWEYLERTWSNGQRWKKKIRKEYFRWTKILFKTKLFSRNLIKGINTWAVRLVRHSGLFLKGTREELRQIDQRIRKLMILHKALYPEGGGRGIANVEDCVETSIHREPHKKIWFGLVSWHIDYCRLFNAKFSLYTYIKCIWFGLV